MEENLKHSHITALIIQAFYKVFNTLRFGLLEKVYERAMLIELQNMGLQVESQKGIIVHYYQNEVGYYSCDLFIEKKVIAELKASSTLCQDDEKQLINYLKATNIEVGILLNFGIKPEFRRKVFTNEFKKSLTGENLRNR